MSRDVEQPEWELRVQVPPGWIEFVAYEDDATAAAAFEALLEPYADSLSREQHDGMRDQLMWARRMSVAANLRIAGAVLTVWEDEQPTVWYYGAWAFGVAGLDGLNPVGLLERALGWAVESEQSALSSLLDAPVQEDFTTVDGRTGTSLYAIVRGSRLPSLAGGDDLILPEEAGLVLAGVPLPGLPDATALVVGVAPSVGERAAMSVWASLMTHSVHVIGGGIDEVPAVDMTLEEAFGDDGSESSG